MVAKVSVPTALIVTRSVRVNMLVFFVAIVSLHWGGRGLSLTSESKGRLPRPNQNRRAIVLNPAPIFSMGDTPSQLVPTHPSLYGNKPLDIGMSHICHGYVYIDGHVRTSHEAQNGESMPDDV